jgi:hypothetical protein
MDAYSVDKRNNLGNWINQRSKLLQFIHNLINEGLKDGEVLDHAQSWNEEQVFVFLPFYVLEEVNLAWRRSVKKKLPMKRCSTADNNRSKQTMGELNESAPRILEEVLTP